MAGVQPSTSGAGMLVASISEALAGNHKMHLDLRPPEWLKRPSICTFREVQGSYAHLTQESQPSSAESASPDFVVMARRHHNHLTRQIQQFMQLGLGNEAAGPLVNFLNNHVLPKLAMLTAAQHRVTQQFEKTRNWRPRMPAFRRSKEDNQSGASSSTYRFGRQAQKYVDLGKQKEREMDPRGAAEYFELALSVEPNNAALFAVLAKQYSDFTYVEGISAAEIVQANMKAIGLSTQALEAQPDFALGAIARCISRGRLALLSDNKTKVQLAKDASDDAQLALRLEPRNDLAHHLMGRWHYEMAGINPMVRTLVRLFYGTALMQGSYQEALKCYRTAAELMPMRLVHRVEYGRCLAKVGDAAAAVRQLEEALQLEVEDLNAHLTKLDCEQLLEKLKSKPNAAQLFFNGGKPTTGST